MTIPESYPDGFFSGAVASVFCSRDLYFFKDAGIRSKGRYNLNSRMHADRSGEAMVSVAEPSNDMIRLFFFKKGALAILTSR